MIKGLKASGTIEEEKRCFELIRDGIEMGNIKLDAISLGKSQDGLRTITLSDIWYDQKQNEKAR